MILGFLLFVLGVLAILPSYFEWACDGLLEAVTLTDSDRQKIDRVRETLLAVAVGPDEAVRAYAMHLGREMYGKRILAFIIGVLVGIIVATVVITLFYAHA